jgi:hypothetical protein
MEFNKLLHSNAHHDGAVKYFNQAPRRFIPAFAIKHRELNSFSNSYVRSSRPADEPGVNQSFRVNEQVPDCERF